MFPEDCAYFLVRQIPSLPELHMEFLFEAVAGDLPEDCRNIIIQLHNHKREPHLLVSLPQYLLKYKILHEGARHLSRRKGRPKIEGMLLLADQFIVDSVTEFVGQRQHIVEGVSMVEQNISRMQDKMMRAEGAARLALCRIDVELSLVKK